MSERLYRLDTLSEESLRRLHRGVFNEPAWIRALFERMESAKTVLDNGVDRSSTPRTGRVVWVSGSRARLAVSNIQYGDSPQIYFRFAIDGVAYFCAVPPVREVDGTLEIELPRAVYEAERRDLARDRESNPDVGPTRVWLTHDGSRPQEAIVRDWSPQGVGVAVPKSIEMGVDSSLVVQFVDGQRAGERCHGSVRYRRRDLAAPGWIRLGIAISSVPTSDLIPIDRRRHILPGGLQSRAWRSIQIATATAKTGPSRLARRLGIRQNEPVEVVTYRNHGSHPMCAIVNRTRDWRGGTVIVIPPAWGKTKETLLPLAMTLVRSFERAGERLVVLRFDGTNRRGESYLEPDCRGAGSEYLRFTFSGAVRDIQATIDFVYGESGIRPRRTILVTTSLSAIEARRAVALDRGTRIHGWISLVGMVDLQSGLRSVSGGVDYAYGLTRGVRFGRHELVGVVADMDWTGHDALQHELVFAEHAHRDMASIDVPVTWIHGRHDAWISLDRVQRLMSSGGSSKRSLIEVPTGHQMRTSREALETFQLVAQEAARIAIGQRIDPAMPRLSELEERMRSERARRPSPRLDLRAFWEDYLLGRDRRVGFKLMTSTKAYRELMSLQLKLLQLREGARVLDLGSGTGDFSRLLDGQLEPTRGISVTEVDYVTSALKQSGRDARGARPGQVVANLALEGKRRLPFRSGTFDAAVASLLVSYVGGPGDLLRQVADCLVAGGRLVVSSLREDADISRIYAEGVSELPPDRVRALLGPDAERDFEILQRSFLNDAARILSLEEDGVFRFWNGDDLAQVVAAAGFRDVEVHAAFGDPPQAVVVSAARA